MKIYIIILHLFTLALMYLCVWLFSQNLEFSMRDMFNQKYIKIYSTVLQMDCPGSSVFTQAFEKLGWTVHAYKHSDNIAYPIDIDRADIHSMIGYSLPFEDKFSNQIFFFDKNGCLLK